MSKRIVLLLGPAILGSIGTCYASAEDADGGQLEEIVVTAQKRSENLQRVPIAVTALSSTALENANIDTAMKLDKVVPSLLLEANSGTVTPYLRGVGSSIAPVGFEASVATYIDGVYYSRLTPILFRLNDVERIEVLKGPQGTLFGRNASGGLIQIITADPQPGQALDFKSSVGYATYNTNDESVSLATGLGKKVGFSLAAVNHNQVDGWGHNVTTGGDAWKDDSRAARVKLWMQPTDLTKIVFEADYSRETGDVGMVGHYYDHAQGAFNSALPLPQIAFYDVRNNGVTSGDIELYGSMLRIEQDLGFATLKNISSLRYDKAAFYQDTDFGPDYEQEASLPSYGRDLQEELQLVSNPGSKLNWTTGLYYMNQHQGYNPARFTGPVFVAYSGGIDNAYVAYAAQRVKSYAGYAQGSYDILPKTTLTLGLRYTRDQVGASGLQGAEIPANGPVTIPFPGTDLKPTATFSKLTWHGALNYQFTPDVMGYISDSRGYKAGTFGLLPLSSDTPAKPEVIDAYEIGMKSEWFDHRLRLNPAAFWYEIGNPQVEVVPIPGVALPSNAKKARIRGVDLDADASVTQQLKLHVGFAYLDAKYLDYQNAQFIFPNPGFPFGNLPAVSGNASGNTMPRAPHATFNFGASYALPTATAGSWVLSANYAYNSGFFWDADNRNRQGSYGLLDAQIACTLPGDAVTVRLWGSNLTGVHYYETVYELGTNAGDAGYPGAPRVIGIAFDYQFQGSASRF